MGTVSDVFISRDKVIEAIEREFGDEARPECISAKEAVYSVKLADVAPVVHGRWKVVYNSVGKQEGQCTHCGKNSGILITKKSYCPHCGAKMDEEEEK